MQVICTDIEECMEDLEANIACNIREHHQMAASECFKPSSNAAPDAPLNNEAASADHPNLGNSNIIQHHQTAAPQSVRPSSSPTLEAHQSSEPSSAEHPNADHCCSYEHHQAAAQEGAQEAARSSPLSGAALHRSLSSEPPSVKQLSVKHSDPHASEGMNQKQISGTGLEQPTRDLSIGDQSTSAAHNKDINGSGDDHTKSGMCQQESQAASKQLPGTSPDSAGDVLHATSNGEAAAYRKTGGNQVHATQQSKSAAETGTAATQLPAAASKARAHAPQENGHACQNVLPTRETVSMDAADERHAPGDAPGGTEKRHQRGRCATRLSCTELDWENPVQIAALGIFDTILVADVVSPCHKFLKDITFANQFGKASGCQNLGRAPPYCACRCAWTLLSKMP